MSSKYLYITILALVSAVMPMQADLLEEANSHYQAGRFAEATELYRQAIEQEPSGDAYYNLGNAYFKQGELAQSILSYERALRIDPGHTDAKHNLEFARTRIMDNIRDTDSFFIASWLRAIRDRVGVNSWLYSSIVLFWLMLAGLLVFLLCQGIAVRKAGFFGALICLIMTCYTGANAWSLNERNTERAEAIITRGTVNAKSSPAEVGTDLFTLHEGTKVVIEETVSGWANIHVGPHNGWVQLQYLERI